METVYYHAHIYYDADSKKDASLLREQLSSNFELELGRWRDKPVGPHSKPMYQVKFKSELFPTLIPWLSFNHHGLSVLIHPNTNDSLEDHTEYALWLGKQLAIQKDFLKKQT